MTNKIFIPIFIGFCIYALNSLAALPKLEHTEISSLYKLEKRAMQNYRSENFSQAYELLSQTAPMGLKQSQYYMAFLYLKGQHVEKSILDGMAWLGVAKESGNKEMLDLFNQLYKAFNQAQKNAVDKKVDEYIRLYGMQTQNVACEKRKKVGSKRLVLQCLKVPIKVDYEINRVPSPMEFQ